MTKEFKVGDRVQMTEKAIDQGLNGRLNRSTGTFCGYAKKPYDHDAGVFGLLIRRDGCEAKKPGYTEQYHPDYWEPISDSV